jgi:hypothetical protein
MNQARFRKSQYRPGQASYGQSLTARDPQIMQFALKYVI